MAQRPNIILIVLDTMRRDALGVYGGPVSTPSIDEFSKDCIIFDNAISPSPWTVPSHASMFTGLYPIEHGINAKTIFDTNLSSNDKARSSNIIPLLNRSGYRTFGVSANNLISHDFSFDYGFEKFANVNWTPGFRETFKERIEKDSSEKQGAPALLNKINDLPSLYKIMKLRKKLKFPSFKGAEEVLSRMYNFEFNSEFFLFLNFMEMHEPYLSKAVRPPTNLPIYNQSSAQKIRLYDYLEIKRAKNSYVKKIRSAYYLESRIIDNYIGKFIKYLKENSLYEDSLIVIVSDHGQSLKDNDDHMLFHGNFLYDEMISVPLVVKFPNKCRPDLEGNRIKEHVSTTLIPDIVRKCVSKGYSRWDDLFSNSPVFSESYGGFNNSAFEKYYDKNRRLYEILDSPRKAVFSDGYKLVVNGRTGSIEEFSYNKKPIGQGHSDALEKLLEELQIFIGRENFKLPSLTDGASKPYEYQS